MDREKCRLHFLLVSIFFVGSIAAENLTLNINFRRPVSVTHEKFLSLTLDPATLHDKNALSTNFEKSASMARALAPAYVRFGGAISNSDQFEGRQDSEDASMQPTFVSSESHWILAHKWAEKAGLDVIACIAPDDVQNNRELRFPQDVPEIVSFSNDMGLNTSWQIGYECQTRCNLPAFDLGKRVANLRKVLRNFPKYSNSIITGPDVVAYRTKRQQEYLQDFLSVAAPALSAITWHPNFAGVTVDTEGVSMHRDNLANDKDDLYKIIGRLAAKRPLWIAESEPEEGKNLFLGALMWARRLGNAAKLKIEVVMRQSPNLSRPTPDYWVSVIHKTLVGRQVFDVKFQNDDEKPVYLYCQCTKPSRKYKKGSITVFGLNLTPRNVAVHLKAVNISNIHQYILLPGFDAPNRMFAETVLLNNESLRLINDVDIPDLNPVNLTHPKSLDLPSGGIGFWVLPELRIKSCMENYESTNERVSSRRTKRKTLKSNGLENAQDEEELENGRTLFARNYEKKSLPRSIKSRKFRHGAKRDLRRLRKYVKKQLDSYDEKKPSGSIHDRSKNANDNEAVRSKLKEFKESLLESRKTSRTNEAKTDDEQVSLVSESLALISKIENSLVASKDEAQDRSKIIKPLIGAKDYLKSLYNILTSSNLGEANESSEEDGSQTRAKRPKREIIPKMTEPPAILRKECLLKKRSRIDRKITPRKNIRREVRPSLLFEHKNSDSGENTFYGFFKTNPAEDFPKGDVFLATADSSSKNDYDYVKNEDSKERPARVHQRAETPSTDYVEADENVWVEDENDYQGYTPSEFFENKLPNFRFKNQQDPSELWEAENYQIEKERSAKAKNASRTKVEDEENSNELRVYHDEFQNTELKVNYGPSKFESIMPNVKPSARIRRLPTARILAARSDRAKSTDQRTRISDYGDHADTRETRRSKRKNKDLNTIFDQEMIKQDDNNSKDCRCRVIRDFDESPKLCRYCRLRRSAVETRNEENASSPESRADLIPTDFQDFSPTDRHLSLDTLSVDNPETTISNVENDFSLEAFNLENEEEFFRPQSGRQDEREKTTTDIIENVTARPSTIWENSASTESSKEKTVAVSVDEDEAFEGSKSFAATSEPTTLSGDEITEEIREDQDSDQSAKETLGGRFVPDETTMKFADNESDREESRKVEILGPNDDFLETKKLTSRAAASKQERAKSGGESARISRAKALLALRKRMSNKNVGRGIMEIPSSNNRAREYQRNRVEQIEKLKEKLREKREKMLQRYEEEILDIVEEINDEEKRKIKRREVWERIKDSDDFRDMIDREKLAYVLMYAPINYDFAEKRVESRNEGVERKYLPATELLRALNVRERMVQPRNHRNFEDPRIMQHSNPFALTERLRLKDMQENIAARGQKYDEDGNGRSYYAFVESLKNPRIFQYQPRNERRKSVPILPTMYYTRNENTHRRPQYQDSYEKSSEEEESKEEESNRLSFGREIYVIDPSKYKGGEPILQAHREASRSSRTKLKSIPQNLYQMILQRAERDPSFKGTLEPLKKYHNRDLLKILTNSHNSPPETNEDSEGNISTQETTNSNTKHVTGEETVANSSETREDHEENLKGEKTLEEPSETRVTAPVVEASENTLTNGWKVEDENFADQVSQTNSNSPINAELNNPSEIRPMQSRKRRGTKEESFNFWLPRFSSGTAQRGGQRSRRKNDLEEDSMIESSNVDPSKVLKLVKENGHYKAVPVEKVSSNAAAADTLVSRTFDDYEPSKETQGNDDDVDIDPAMLERLRILLPSELPDKYVKESYSKHQFEDYKDTSSSLEGSLDLERSDENSNQFYLRSDEENQSKSLDSHKADDVEHDESDEGSHERVNLKDLFVINEPEVLRILMTRKNKKFRLRRQTQMHDEINENQHIDRVQSLELQEPNEATQRPAIRAPNSIDDVDGSMKKKFVPNKIPKKYNLERDYVNKKSEIKGLPSFIEGTLPELGNVLANELEKAQNLTESVEQYIENFDEKFNETLTTEKENDPINKNDSIARTVFQAAITNIKKFFILFGGIARILHQ